MTLSYLSDQKTQGELELRECKYVDIPARWIDSSVAVK